MTGPSRDGSGDSPTINEYRRAAGRVDADAALLRDVAHHATALMEQGGDDGAAQLIAEAAKQTSTGRVDIVVVGAFKSGKTTVVNGLLGGRVIPAGLLSEGTLPTFVAHGEQTEYEAVVVDEKTQRLARTPLDESQYLRAATEPGARFQDRRIDHLRVTVPSPLLGLGIRLIDTPGFSGGMASVAARRVLELAHRSDVALMVTDASQELSRSEVEFLRVLQTLCKKTIVVMSRIDLCLDWPRVLERNEEHLSALESPPQILAVGAGLQRLAARLEDASMARESGYPFLSWYLATNVVASARYQDLREAHRLISATLAAARTDVELRLATLASVASRDALDADLEETTRSLKALKRDLPRNLRKGFQASNTVLSRDLKDRFSELSARLEQQLASIESTDEWTEIESQAIRGVNHAWAQHLLLLDQTFRGLVKGLQEGHDLNLGDQLAAEALESAGELLLGAYVDPPEYDRSGERLQRNYSIMRGSATGGSMGIGAISGVAALIQAGAPLLAAIPLVGVAAAAGGLVGVRILGRPQKGLRMERWRAEAERRVKTYLAKSREDLVRGSEDRRSAFFDLVDATTPDLIDELIERKAAEADRLLKLSRQARTNKPEAELALRSVLDRFDLVQAHADRLGHRLDRPDLAALQ